MNNKVFLSYIKEIQKQDMSHFAEVYDIFEGLIGFYGHRLGYEDAKQELTLFLLELLYSINTDAFLPDETEGLKRYIAVALRNKYIQLSKSDAEYNTFNRELNDNSVGYIFKPENSISLKDAFENLSSKQKRVIIYRYIYDYSITEISDKFGISRQAVNRIKNRGLKILKSYYGNYVL